MPDIIQICEQIVKADKQTRYGLLNCIYGSVDTTGANGKNITAPHLFGWYPEIIKDHLEQAGFVDIQFPPIQFPHPGPNFRVECRKP
jgi:hypothetical protein